MAVDFIIRPIAMKDVQSVQRVAQIAWHRTYGTIYTMEFINSFLEQAYSQNSLEAAVSRDEAREARKFLVAECDSEIVGYAQLAETQDGEAELLRIYILPAFQGNGIGKALLEELIKSDKTVTKVFAWVEKANQAGINFYKSTGFLCEEEKEETVEGKIAVLNKYVKQVT